MSVKQHSRQNLWANIRARFQKRWRLLPLNGKLLIVVVSFGVYSAAVYLSGLWTCFQAGDTVAVEKAASVSKPRHTYNPSLSSPERIEIGISQTDFEKLSQLRQKALKTGILSTNADSYVPAKIRYQGRVYRAKIRLKGDWAEHVEGSKWSFRVSVKGGDTLWGMREFSIQHPARRNYIYGWLFHAILKREDIIGLRGKLIDVTLNQKELGLYYFEEHFDKLLIENNHRREGPILKFDEDLLWAQRERKFGDAEFPWAYYASEVEVFQPSKVYRREDLKAQFEQGYALLEGFRRGELSGDEVFDVRRLGRYYALSDLLGAHHMAFYHNLRFYYNPLTRRLEPIGFDADAGNPIRFPLFMDQFRGNPYYDFHKRLMNDPAFLAVYLRELDRLAFAPVLEEHLSALKPELGKKLNILYKEFPVYHFAPESFVYNREVIQKALLPVKGIRVSRLSEDAGTLKLAVGNLQAFPVELGEVTIQGRPAFRPINNELLSGRSPDEQVKAEVRSWSPLPGAPSPQANIKDWRLKYRVAHTHQWQSAPITEENVWARPSGGLEVPRRQSNAELFSWLSLDSQEQIAWVQPGRWTLDQELRLPRGWITRMGPGTEIVLTSGGRIVAQGPVQWIGTADHPVRLFADKGGEGVVVLAEGQGSVLRNVTFEGLSAPSVPGWGVTGGVTFVESPVRMESCHFMNSGEGDDALNLVRSPFHLTSVVFENSRSDALDVDFSNGRIERSFFAQSGNDAMDFSGSVVTVQSARVNTVGDKGVSAGEASQVILEDIEISGAPVGMASKDNSKVTVKNVTLTNCRVGFAVYQKKPEFGPAELEISNLTHQGVGTLYMKQPECRIIMHR